MGKNCLLSLLSLNHQFNYIFNLSPLPNFEDEVILSFMILGAVFMVCYVLTAHAPLEQPGFLLRIRWRTSSTFYVLLHFSALLAA